MKQWILMSLLSLTMLLGGCSASNESYYEHAQLMLGWGDHAGAAELFVQLGEYRDSGDYVLYCAALQALQTGEYELAQANFALVPEFKSSPRYLRYLEALQAEEDGRLEDALAVYETLGSFEDSRTKAEALRKKIPEEALSRAKKLVASGEHEQAREILLTLGGWGNSAELIAQIDQALLEQAYTRAEAFYASGDYPAALDAFESMGDHLDAAKRAQDCRAAMYRELEEAYAGVTLSTAPDLLARYAELEGYGESETRMQEIGNRFQRSLQLLQETEERPYVIWGQYPFGESGLPGELLWRVLDVQGHEVTLLCEAVIDALPASAPLELMLTEEEEAHVICVTLPSLEDLAGMSEEDMTAIATPYAMAQGVRHHSDGRAWWWVNHTARMGRNAIVWYNGRVLTSGVDAGETVVGVRPMLRLDLEVLTFTEGDGTQEHPYR